MNSKTSFLRVIQHIKVHTKYVLRTSWSIDGLMFVSASNDKTVCKYIYSMLFLAYLLIYNIIVIKVYLKQNQSLIVHLLLIIK